MYLRRTMAALIPPMPRVLHITAFSGFSSIVLLKCADPRLGSGSSKLIVGITAPYCIIRQASAASIAPAAASVWPNIDLGELTDRALRVPPKIVRIAEASV